MTTGRTRRRGWAGAVLALAVAAPSASAAPVWLPPQPAAGTWEADGSGVRPSAGPARPKLTPTQLRARAIAAEAVGEWEAAFAAYYHLHLTDRTSPDIRDRLNAALRRVQQSRRHRDPAYRQYVAGLSAADAVAVFGEVVAKVPAMHADAGRSTPQQLWAGGVDELHRAVGDAAFRKAFLGDPPADARAAFRTDLQSNWAKRTVADAREARAALKELVAATADAFPAASPAAVAVEVLAGACAGLDEYTVFLPPVGGDGIASPTDLSGYGIDLATGDGGYVVEAVAPASWAAFHTAVRAGDRLARVNGRTLAPGGLADALRRPTGGVYEVEFAPADGMMTPQVVRLPVVLPTVYGGRVVSSKDGVGYLRVGEFRDTTPHELADEVAALRGQGVRALVLDLRGNPGGSFLAGVEVARRFLPGGVVVGTQGQLGQVAGQVFAATAGPAAIDLPLVVLVDGETASAAEVVAAALKENGRAVLVGAPTFGKGAVQYPLRLTAADRDAPRSGTVRLTIARLLGPRGAPLNGAGVTPHVLAADPAAQWEVAVQHAATLPPPLRPMPMVPPGD
ncbi:MAG: hypothetical protein K2X82_07295 [Gemmataceae bacterium]|nr:hypothetical protein [Gemmataceae bacterium]